MLITIKFYPCNVDKIVKNKPLQNFNRCSGAPALDPPLIINGAKSKTVSNDVSLFVVSCPT